MDIQTLKLFITLARNLHFGKTSEEMHMSPSAVSRAIQRLEDQIGHSLLIRDNRSVQLTEEGQIFLEYALEVTKRWEALLGDLDRHLDRQSGLWHPAVNVDGWVPFLGNDDLPIGRGRLYRRVFTTGNRLAGNDITVCILCADYRIGQVGKIIDCI